MMIKRKRNCRGQAIVEYIIIVVIVAVAALTVMGFFSDTIRKQINRVTVAFGGKETTVTDGSSTEFLKNIDAESPDN